MHDLGIWVYVSITCFSGLYPNLYGKGPDPNCPQVVPTQLVDLLLLIWDILELANNPQEDSIFWRGQQVAGSMYKICICAFNCSQFSKSIDVSMTVPNIDNANYGL